MHRAAPRRRGGRGRVGRCAAVAAALGLLLIVLAPPLAAEVQIVFHGSTGLGLDGLKGYLGGYDPRERIVVVADEAPVHLLFFWDSPSLDPWATVTDATGAVVGEYELGKANRIVLARPGRHVVVLESRGGAGHWFCVVLGSREWNPYR